MGELDPMLPGNETHEIPFDPFRVFFRSEPQPDGNPSHMSIHYNPRDAERIAQNDIGRLPPDPRQCHQCIEVCGDFSLILLMENPAAFFDVPCFVSIESRGSDLHLQFDQGSFGEMPGTWVFPEEARCDLVDPIIRALSGQDRGNEELQGIYEFQRTTRIRIVFIQEVEDRFNLFRGNRRASLLSLRASFGHCRYTSPVLRSFHESA